MLFEDTVDILSDCSSHDPTSAVSLFQLAVNEVLCRQSLSCGLRRGDSDGLDEFALETVTVEIAEDLFPEVVVEEEELIEEIAAVEEHIALTIHNKRIIQHSSCGVASNAVELEVSSSDDIFSDYSFFSFGDDFSILGFSGSNRNSSNSEPDSKEVFHGVCGTDEAPSKKRKTSNSHYQQLSSVEVVIIEECAPLVPASSSSPAQDIQPSSPPHLGQVDISALSNFDTTPLSKKRRGSPKQSSKKKNLPGISRKELKLEPTTNPAVKMLLTEKPNLYQGEEILRISKLQSNEDEEIDIGDDYDC